MKIRAKFVEEGDFLTGLDNGYVFEEPDVNNGYLSYPSTHGGMSSAMPMDTILIGYHDNEGEENYLLLRADTLIEVKGDKPESERENLIDDDEDEDED